MRRIFVAVCCWLGLAATAMALPSSLRVCWEEGEKPPYLMIEDNGAVRGIAVEMLTDILWHAGIRPEHVIRPWRRCLAELEAGQVDLVPNASYRSDRAQYALYSDELYETHLALFYRKDRFRIPPRVTDRDSMQGFRLGGVLGFNYDQYQGLVRIDTSARDREMLLRMLQAGRFHLALEQVEVVRMMAQQGLLDWRELAYVPDPIVPTRAFHVLISKRLAEAVPVKAVVDRGIERLQRSGQWQRIHDRYLGVLSANN
ncbi:ABC transporter substrate-binding protein [Chitinibacter tainanensis]|uniref:substrate-binding periplasmic protein n=1 Tax=Chitinibacter tainanensis TaxID=230667 RepID=UPI0023546AD9|nr:transporter substrate-binding domain-containing protein [Chitinibacter tainanensis]